MAVKILIKRKIKDRNMQAAARLLINSRKGAMTQPGYISSETMRSLNDPAHVVVVSMWQNREDWETWKGSDTRLASEREFEDYIVGHTEYEHYSLGLAMDSDKGTAGLYPVSDKSHSAITGMAFFANPNNRL